MKLKTKKGFGELVAFIAVMAAVLVVIFVGLFCAGYYQEEDVVITVKDKERVVDRGGESARYLIWSKEGDVYENVDTFIKFKFNSSDIYGQLEKDKTYVCRVYGWRNGFFSMYRNIVKCKEKGE